MPSSTLGLFVAHEGMNATTTFEPGEPLSLSGSSPGSSAEDIRAMIIIVHEEHPSLPRRRPPQRPHPRFWRVLRVLVLLCLVGPAAGSAPPEPKQVVLNIWAVSTDSRFMGTLVQEFMRANPDIAVKLHIIPKKSSHEKLVRAALGDTLPDLSPLPSGCNAEFMMLNVMQPLNGFLASSTVDTEDYFPGIADSYRQGGTWFGLPWYVGTHLIFYRKDHLAAVGYKSFPETWDDFHRLCAKLKAARPNDYPLMVRYDREGILLSLFLQAGGDLMGEDGHGVLQPTAALADAFRRIRHWRDNGWTPWGSELRPGKVRSFMEGHYSMLVQGPWVVWDLLERAPELTGLWGTAQYPGPRKGVTLLRTSGLVMFRSCRHKPEAWRLMEFLASPRAQVAFFREAQSLPVSRAAWKAPELANAPYFQAFYDQLQDARTVPFDPDWVLISSQMTNTLDQLAHNQISVEEAPTLLHQRVKRALDRSALWQPRLYRAALALIVLNVFFLGIVWYLRSGAGLAFSPLAWLRLQGALKFLLPALTLLLMFRFIPIAWSFFASLTNWDLYGIADPNRVMFIGLENYRRLWSDSLFRQALTNTLLFLAIGAPLRILLALIIALALHRCGRRLQTALRLGFFLPVVTTLVAASIIWQWIFHIDKGLLKGLVTSIGLAGHSWLDDPEYALAALIIVSVWKGFGYNMVIFLVARQNIDESLYEAARIDGANDWQQFRHITLPGLKHATTFALIVTGIGYLQIFSEPYIITRGGPANRTVSLVLYLYQQGFRFFRFGYASAIAFTLLGITLLLALLRQYAKRRLIREASS